MQLQHPDWIRRQQLKDQIEELREKLHRLTDEVQNYSLIDEIMGVSRELDELISEYYKMKLL